MNVQNIKIEPMKVYFNEVDVGLLDGEITVSTKEETKEITAHQTGSNVLSDIRTGMKVEVKLVLKETSKAQIEAMQVSASKMTTPNVMGYGFKKDFTQTIEDAKTLRLHPVALADSDKSRDFNFWKAYPMLEEFKFSGDATFNLPITFKIYPDLTKADEMNYLAIGEVE